MRTAVTVVASANNLESTLESTDHPAPDTMRAWNEPEVPRMSDLKRRKSMTSLLKGARSSVNLPYNELRLLIEVQMKSPDVLANGS